MRIRRITAQEVGPNGPTYLTVWIASWIAAGHVALPALVVVMLFAKHLKRRVLLINACVTWIVASVCYSLLFYAGRYRNSDPEPNSDLCVGQASLVGAIPILTCTATLVLAYDLLRTHDDSDAREYDLRSRRVVISVSLLQINQGLSATKHLSQQVIVPYAAFGIFVALGVMLSIEHIDRVDREQRFFYCSLNWNPLTYAIGFMSTIICLAAAVLEVQIVSLGIRRWRLTRRPGHLPDENISLYLRTFAFTLYLLASTVVNLVSNWVDMSVVPDLLSASVGIVVFLLFATQKRIVFFWRRPVPALSTHMTSPTQPHIPFLAAGDNVRDTVNTDRTSKNTYSSSIMLRDYYHYEAKAHGVEVIGRPDEAFASAPNPAPHV